MTQRGHGIALFSGGLDSSVAILMIVHQHIRVTALTFLTDFGCNAADDGGRKQLAVGERFGFDVKPMPLGQEFVDMIKNPAHGHGRNMNPCIDCRIMMLRAAKQYLEEVGADFVFTGEVLGQRPMTQRRPQLDMIAKQAGLQGKLVRPLSARFFAPTDPEQSGLIDRSKLEAITGRSRRRQMELARQFGLEDYPSPAGGCLLTDPGYSRRLRELLTHRQDIDFNDLQLLRTGRHFRADAATKIIVGRNQAENTLIERQRRPDEWLFEARGTGSPLSLLRGSASAENIRLAAALTARYCDSKYRDAVEITCFCDQSDPQIITVPPLDDQSVAAIRIQ